MTDIPQSTIDELRRLCEGCSMEAPYSRRRMAELSLLVLTALESAQANERRAEQLQREQSRKLANQEDMPHYTIKIYPENIT